MADIPIDDLIDMKGHCLLCFRECVSSNENILRNDDNQQDDGEVAHANHNGELCKKFLRIIATYLRIPLASLNLFYDNEDTPRNVHTRWDALISGSICDQCKSNLVDPICNLYSKMDYMRLQLQLKVQALDDFNHFANQNDDCRNAKMRLHEKWILENQDSHHFFKLIDLLKDEISAKSEKIKKFPFVSLQRIPDKHSREVLKTKEQSQPEHRPSVEDSGVSLNSAQSPGSSYGESSEMDQLDNENETTPTPVKELKVMRRVFTCKVCREKHFSRVNLNAHYVTAHYKPKSTSANDPPPQKVFKIRKTAYTCPVKGCNAKFMNKELFMQHSTNGHSRKTPENISHLDETEENNINGSAKQLPQQNNVVENATLSSVKTGSRGPYQKRVAKCRVAGCVKKFHNAEQLLLHNQFHLNHPCSFCGVFCNGPALLANHELKEHKEPGSSVVKNIKCPRCSEVLVTYFNYRAHFYAAHLGVKAPALKCSKCPVIFTSDTARKKHIRTGICQKQSVVKKSNASPEAAFINPTTPAVDNTNNRNVNQVADSVGTKKYDCNICNLSVSSFTALQTHVIARHDPNMQFCSDCERIFKDKDTLNNHRVQIHFKLTLYKKYCKYCAAKKHFKGASEYAAHIKAHENKKGKRYVQNCSICHKKFRNLGLHMRVHALQEAGFPVTNRFSLNKKSSEEKGSLADRIKLRGGRRLLGSQRRTKNEQFDGADTVGVKKQGNKQMRKSKRLLSTAPVYYDEGSDDNDGRAIKRKKVRRQPVNRNQKQERENQDESSNSKQEPAPVKAVRETPLSPLNNNSLPPPPPRILPPSQEDGGESCTSDETDVLNKTANTPEEKARERNPDERLHLDVLGTIKTEPENEPGSSHVPQINEKFQKWMSKYKSINVREPISSHISRPLNMETTTAEKAAPKVVEYISLSDDEEQEVKVDPATCNISNKADLYTRVDNWLSSRTPPNEEDIITID